MVPIIFCFHVVTTFTLLIDFESGFCLDALLHLISKDLGTMKSIIVVIALSDLVGHTFLSD